MPELNTHAIDIHPESPADWPLLPAAVDRGHVMLDLFSWSLLLARLLTEWEDLGEPNDMDVAYGLGRVQSLMKATHPDDGWVDIGYVQEGDVVRIVGLTDVFAGSGANFQHVEYPIRKLDKPRPFGAAFSEPIRP